MCILFIGDSNNAFHATSFHLEENVMKSADGKM